MKSTILIIDDIPENIVMLSMHLKDTYKVLIAMNGEEAINIAQISSPNLILINTITAELDGYAVCNQFKSDCILGEIPIILIVEQKRFNFLNNSIYTGIVDYIEQPIDITLLIYRIRIHIDYKEVICFLKSQKSSLKNIIDNMSDNNLNVKEIPALAMASFAQTKDYSTGKHVMRTQIYVKELADKLKDNTKYGQYLTDERIELIVKSAPLHDVGKVGIPDSILLKPGPLTIEEFDVIKTHPKLGLSIVAFLEKNIDNLDEFMETAKDIVYSHHERWDGKGYPQGLMGEEIPISARIVSVADVYDALVSDRVYKNAFPHDTAVKIISDESGGQFDPDMVDAFLSLEKEFNKIAELHKND